MNVLGSWFVIKCFVFFIVFYNSRYTLDIELQLFMTVEIDVGLWRQKVLVTEDGW